jgi:hypothetical protein
MKAISLLILCPSLFAVDGQFLDKLASIESSGNPKAIGDGGRAIGMFQFHKAAWQDTSRLRRMAGKAVYPYQDAVDASKAREYAKTFCDSLEARLEKRLGRPPTDGEVYGAWNLGFTGFARRGFDLAKCPAITQRAAKKFR